MFMITISRSDGADAKAILELQKLAYQTEAQLYNDLSIPPLVQSLEDLEAEYKTHVFLKAVKGGVIIGSVRAYGKDGTCHIGRLIVRPDYQNKGCLLYTSPSPRDYAASRMPSSA